MAPAPVIEAPEVIEIIPLTPMADWLEEHWTEDRYRAQNLGFDFYTHTSQTGCVVGALNFWRQSPWYGQDFITAWEGKDYDFVVHQNNKYGHRAAIDAVRLVELRKAQA